MYESAIELGQGQVPLFRLVAVGGLIKPSAQGEHALGDRLELVTGRLLGLGREHVDASFIKFPNLSGSRA
jgi:hypothetical protein